MLDDAVRHKEKERRAPPSFLPRGSRAPLLAPGHDAPQGPGAPLRPELPHRLSFFRRGPPSVASQAPAACTHSRF